MSEISHIQIPKANLDSIAKKVSEPSKLEKAAKEFEAVFLDIVFKSMRDTVQDSEAFGDSEKPKFFRQMLDSEYAKQMSDTNGGIGVAKEIVRQLGKRTAAEERLEQLKAMNAGGSVK